MSFPGKGFPVVDALDLSRPRIDFSPPVRQRNCGAIVISVFTDSPQRPYVTGPKGGPVFVAARQNGTRSQFYAEPQNVALMFGFLGGTPGATFTPSTVPQL